MASTKGELFDWLQELDHDVLIGVDDGGLCLCVVGSGEYFEIGGLPEDEGERGPSSHSTGNPQCPALHGGHCYIDSHNV